MPNDSAENELMKKTGFAMLVTHDGDRLRARPMSAFPARDSNAIQVAL